MNQELKQSLGVGGISPTYINKSIRGISIVKVCDTLDRRSNGDELNNVKTSHKSLQGNQVNNSQFGNHTIEYKFGIHTSDRPNRKAPNSSDQEEDSQDPVDPPLCLARQLLEPTDVESVRVHIPPIPVFTFGHTSNLNFDPSHEHISVSKNRKERPHVLETLQKSKETEYGQKPPRIWQFRNCNTSDFHYNNSNHYNSSKRYNKSTPQLRLNLKTPKKIREISLDVFDVPRKPVTSSRTSSSTRQQVRTRSVSPLVSPISYQGMPEIDSSSRNHAPSQNVGTGHQQNLLNNLHVVNKNKRKSEKLEDTNLVEDYHPSEKRGAAGYPPSYNNNFGPSPKISRFNQNSQEYQHSKNYSNHKKVLGDFSPVDLLKMGCGNSRLGSKNARSRGGSSGVNNKPAPVGYQYETDQGTIGGQNTELGGGIMSYQQASYAPETKRMMSYEEGSYAPETKRMMSYEEGSYDDACSYACSYAAYNTSNEESSRMSAAMAVIDDGSRGRAGGFTPIMPKPQPKFVPNLTPTPIRGGGNTPERKSLGMANLNTMEEDSVNYPSEYSSTQNVGGSSGEPITNYVVMPEKNRNQQQNQQQTKGVTMKSEPYSNYVVSKKSKEDQPIKSLGWDLNNLPSDAFAPASTSQSFSQPATGREPKTKPAMQMYGLKNERSGNKIQSGAVKTTPRASPRPVVLASTKATTSARTPPLVKPTVIVDKGPKSTTGVNHMKSIGAGPKTTAPFVGKSKAAAGPKSEASSNLKSEGTSCSGNSTGSSNPKSYPNVGPTFVGVSGISTVTAESSSSATQKTALKTGNEPKSSGAILGVSVPGTVGARGRAGQHGNSVSVIGRATGGTIGGAVSPSSTPVDGQSNASSDDESTRQMYDKNTLRLMPHWSNLFSAVIDKIRRVGLAHYMKENHRIDTVKMCNEYGALAGGSKSGGNKLAPLSIYVRKRPLWNADKEKGDYDCVSIVDANSSVVDHHASSGGDGMKPGGNYVCVHNCLFQADLKTPFIQNSGFVFDRAYNEVATNEEVYGETTRHLLENSTKPGSISTIFMLGQTGSGKTHTMTALEVLAADDLFKILSKTNRSAGAPYCRVAFVEMRSNKVFCLLSKKDVVKSADVGKLVSNDVVCDMREVTTGKYECTGCRWMDCYSADDLKKWMRTGHGRRHTEATSANDTSSRSHACIIIEMQPLSRLVLVDAAGTERKKDSMAHTKERQEETAFINASLYSLKECIRLRAEKGEISPHVYRQTVLTKLLAESFMGIKSDGMHTNGTNASNNIHKAMLSFICTMSPNATDVEHTLTTLKTAYSMKPLPSSREKEYGHANLKQTDLKKYLGEMAEKPIPVPKWSCAEVQEWVMCMLKERIKTKEAMVYAEIEDSSNRISTSTNGQMLSRFTIQRFKQIFPEPIATRLFDELKKELKTPGFFSQLVAA